MEDSQHEYSQLEQNRLDKATRLREQGIDPYPHRVERSHTSQEAIKAFEATEDKEDTRKAIQATSGRAYPFNAANGQVGFCTY